MREASLWARDLLSAARSHPDQLTKIVEKIQAEAKCVGFGDAMTFATATAADTFALLPPEAADRPIA